MLKTNKIKLVRKYDFEKLIFLICVTLFGLFVYVLITKNYLEPKVNNKKLIEICNFIDKNIVALSIVSFTMFYSSYIFVCFSILRKKINIKDSLLLFIVIFIVWLLKFAFERYSFSNLFDLVIFVCLIIFFKASIKRTIIGLIITFAYTFLNSYIKGVCISTIDFQNISTLLAFIFSIDLYLTYFCVYSIIVFRKENNYGKMVTIFQIFKNLESYFRNFSNNFSSRSNSNSNSNCKIKIYNAYCCVIFTSLIYLCLLILGIIFNRYIEITLSVIYFHFLRGKETETFHCITNDINCFIVSIINFIIVLKLSLPIYLSFIVCILLSYFLCVAMRLIYYVSIKIKNSKAKSRREIILSYVENNEEEIEKICKSLCLKNTSEIVYLFLNNTIEETSEILDIPTRTINNKINNFIKKLEC